MLGVRGRPNCWTSLKGGNVSDLLEYKGYHTQVKYSAEDDCSYGKVEDIAGSITFDDEGYDSVRTAFEEAVDEYLAVCEQNNIKPIISQEA